MKKQETQLQLNVAIVTETIRKNGTLEITQDFSNCPSLTEQHGAKNGDVNHLIKTYTANELDMYLSQRNANRPEITGHDFSQEPNLQEAKNEVLRLQQAYEQIPDDLQKLYPTLTTFLKFIDNPQNVEKMIDLKILTRKQTQQFNPVVPTTQTPTNTPPPVAPLPTTI